MKNINSEKIFSELKNVVYRFPLAILFAGIMTGIEISDDSFLMVTEEPFYLAMTLGFIFSIIAQFVYEDFFEERMNLRWLSYGIVIVLVGLYYFFALTSISLIDGDWNIYSIPGIQTMILHFISIILLIWTPTIKNRIKFSESFLIIFKSFFISSFFSIVLFLGVAAILAIFETLFFTVDTNWWSYSSTIIFSFFGPVLFLTLLLDSPRIRAEKAKDPSFKMSKFLYNLITYIFIPINAVLTAIILLYVLTNFLTILYTKSALEALILSYTISGWILLTLADPVNHILGKWFKKIFPYSLILVLVLQMISTFSQIKRVGLTHGRYLILVFGVGSIISAVWYLIKKESLRVVPIVALIAGIISLIPPIGAMSLSVRQQRNRIDTILQKNEMLVDGAIDRNVDIDVSEYDQEKVIDSVNYLKEIKALNQLKWLPEEYYGKADEYLDFEVSESYNRPGIDVGDYDDNYEETSIAIGEENLNIPISEYNQMIKIQLDSEEAEYQETVEINDESYQVKAVFRDDLIITLTSDSNEDEHVFNFDYILDDFEYVTDYELSIDKLTFSKEEDGIKIQIIIQYLTKNENYQDVEFYLFF